METTTYLRIDADELDDVLTKIEDSYSITFGTNDLLQVETFGQLCEAITEKIQLADVEDCTSQQAFYKLRQSIVDVLHIDRQAVRPDTELAVLLPASTRKASVQQLEKAMGFDLDLIMASPYMTIPAQVVLIGSAILLFKGNVPIYAGAGMAMAILLYIIALKWSRHLTVKTVGKLAEKLAREHYTKVRRDSCTVNKRELTEQIRQVFCADLGINPDRLQPDSRF